jgi:hypothetical protein
METTMHYKTIIFELLQQRPKMHAQLRKYRILLPAMEVYATQLRNSHQTWKGILSELWPAKDQSQIEIEALEMALMEMESHLPPDPSQDDEPSLEGAMAFIQRHTPHE